MTTPRSYRLGDATQAEIEALAEHLGVRSHAEIIRLAVRKMHRELLEPSVEIRGAVKAKRKAGKR